jgi:hypothetical protein
MAYFNPSHALDFTLFGRASTPLKVENGYGSKQAELAPCLTTSEAVVTVGNGWKNNRVGPRTYQCLSPDGLELNYSVPTKAVGSFPLNCTQVKRTR